MSTKIKRSAAERSGRAGSLQYPPVSPYPFMLASHHVAAEKIENRGANLNCSIERSISRNWPQKRIQLPRIILR